MQFSDELIAGFGGALVGALIAGIVAWLLHRSQQTAVKKTEFRRAILSLLGYREELVNRIPQISDPQSRENAAGFIAAKRLIEIETVEALVADVGAQVSTTEYTVLGNELWLDSNFSEAEKYYKQAVDAAKSMLSKVNALRAIAAFYFSPGPQRDFERGRKYFERAAAVFNGATDPYSTYTQGYTYESWGFSELSNGFKVEGAQKLDRARKYYYDMPTSHPLRNQALESLTRRLKTAMNPTETAPGATVASPEQISHLLEEGQKPVS